MERSSNLETLKVRFDFLPLSNRTDLLIAASSTGISKALLEFYASDKLKDSRSETKQNDVEHVRGGRLFVLSFLSPLLNFLRLTRSCTLTAPTTATDRPSGTSRLATPQCTNSSGRASSESAVTSSCRRSRRSSATVSTSSGMDAVGSTSTD